MRVRGHHRPTPTATARLVWPTTSACSSGDAVFGRTRSAPLGCSAVFFIETLIVGFIGSAWIGILVSIVITAFFIPNMLRKGTVDLLLVKPIHRTTLLLYKYVGGLTFIFLNTAVAVLGIWLALGLRSGVWATPFSLSIFVLTFFFAILYSASTLFAVLTPARSWRSS